MAWARIGAAAAAIGAAIGLAALLAIHVVGIASLGYRLPEARAHVAAAFASGELGDATDLPGDTDRGVHQFNDCLILFQAIDQDAPRAVLAVSPLAQLDEPCRTLRAYAGGAAQPGAEPYRRYLHGHTIVTRLLLPHLGVNRIRLLWKTLSTALAAGGAILAIVMLARGGGADHLVWLILFLLFARGFGLEGFGQSLGHGPADAVLLGFLLALHAARCRGGLSARWVAPLAGLLGAGTILFEFLTGGLPLGIAALIGALPFALADQRPRAILSAIVAGLCGFAGAVAAALAAQLVLLWRAFGQAALGDVGGQLAVRSGLAGGGEAVGGIGRRLWNALQPLMVGMPVLASIALAGAIGGGAWAVRRLSAAPDRTLRAKAQALALSNAAILGWIAAFSQHFLIHGRFMGRILVWPIASGLALVALAIVEMRADHTR